MENSQQKEIEHLEHQVLESQLLGTEEVVYT